MESALSWLGELFDGLMKLLPRVVVIRSTHRGVAFWFGKYPRLCNPGVVIWWPVVSELDIVPVNRQTQILPRQTLRTKDGKTVGVAALLVYEVHDALLLITKAYDWQEVVHDMGAGAIAAVVTDHNSDFLRNEGGQVSRQLTRQLRADLKRFGVKVVKFRLTDVVTMDISVAHWGRIPTTEE